MTRTVKKPSEDLASTSGFGSLLSIVIPGTTSSFPNHGIRIAQGTAGGLAQLGEQWHRLGIDGNLVLRQEGSGLRVAVDPCAAAALMPEFDTLDLSKMLGLEPTGDDDLLREIWLTLLNSPQVREFPTVEELMASVRMRRSIVRNAERTWLNFDTVAVERPADCWQYSEETGFVLKPGCALIESLRKACQPEITGQLYAFSCARATEYVMLLAIAEEAERSNPELLHDLEAQWQVKAIQAGRFRQAFAEEYGSMDSPLPMRYYVPGDRVWFRNPDAQSFEAKGFEGSWVFYLGGGLFTNFWKLNQPFSLLQKCLEIYHWRHGTWLDANGEWQMDEPKVERLVAETLADPAETARVFERLSCLRDPGAVFAEGGCMDVSREAPRFVLPPHCDMIFQMNDWP